MGVTAAIAGPIAGAAVGGLMSGGGSQQAGTTTTTQSNEPWSGIQPYLQGGVPGVHALYPNASYLYGRGVYPGSYITSQSPYSSSAISGLASQAQDPNSLVGSAQRTLGGTIRGDYLDVNSNPYLQGAVQQALDQVQRNVSSRFSGDAYGGSSNQEWLGKSLAGTALPIYANAYQQERQNQLNALPLSASLQSANLDQLLRAGALQEGRGQAEIQAGQQQFYAPWDVLSRYGQVLGAINTPASGSTSSPYYTNPTANLLGGALAGAQLGSQLTDYFSGPISNSSFNGNFMNSYNYQPGAYNYGWG